MRSNKFNIFNNRVGKIPALFVLNERQKMDNKIKKIRELNDNLRQNFSGGRVMLTRGVADLPLATRLKIMQKVQNFNNFNASNDPYGEYDFGGFDYYGNKICLIFY